MGLGDAVERSHDQRLDVATSHTAVGDAFAAHGHDASPEDVSGGESKRPGDVVGHGCHGCTAIPAPFPQFAAAPVALDAALAWAAVPSTAGREPLIDLPPPRA